MSVFSQKTKQLNKQQQQLDKSPLCYYHQGYRIAYFCKNSNCTLPLCQKCLDIHKVQHIQKKQIPTQNILSYSQAKAQIMQKLKYKQNLQQIKQQTINQNLKQYRNSIIAYVDEIIKRMRQNILVQNGCLKQISQIKFLQKGIKQNSLKDLIESYQKYLDFKPQHQHYDQTQRTYGLKLLVDEKGIKQSIQKGLLNLSINTKVYKPINCDQNQKKYSLNKNDQNQRSSKSFKRKSIFNKQKQKNQTIGKPQFTPIKAINYDGGQIQLEKQSSFVKKYQIREPQNDEELNKKSKNIYTDQNYQIKNLDAKYIQNSRVSKISSTYSNKSGKNRKGLSLTKINFANKNIIGEKIKQSKLRSVQKLIKTQNDLGKSFLRRSSADWKKVVHMDQNPSNPSNYSGYSRVLTEQNQARGIKRQLFKFDNSDIDVLSPSQMRDFLKRKNIDKKLNESNASSMKKI